MSRGPKAFGGWKKYHAMARRPPEVTGIDKDGNRVVVPVQSFMRLDSILTDMWTNGFTEITVGGHEAWNPITVRCAVKILEGKGYRIERRSMVAWGVKFPQGDGYLMSASSIIRLADERAQVAA